MDPAIISLIGLITAACAAITLVIAFIATVVGDD